MKAGNVPMKDEPTVGKSRQQSPAVQSQVLVNLLPEDPTGHAVHWPDLQTHGDGAQSIRQTGHHTACVRPRPGTPIRAFTLRIRESLFYSANSNSGIRYSLILR
jgi:hypothetical protein